jgi:hypothetical protein
VSRQGAWGARFKKWRLLVKGQEVDEENADSLVLFIGIRSRMSRFEGDRSGAARGTGGAAFPDAREASQTTGRETAGLRSGCGSACGRIADGFASGDVNGHRT